MKIGTILFTYHRDKHTKKVIEALSNNDILPEKLYIFQDGIKEDTDYKGWERVNEIINGIKWCDTEIHISQKNKGLSKTITSGINYVLQKCDAVIILEDDCVPCPRFMGFMISALNRYQDEKKVYSISGYAWDIDLKHQRGDAYFNGKSCSWGWGTWKDRWMHYDEDYRILAKIKNDPQANKRLQIWGRNMESMIVGNVTGSCDSWAVFWGLKIIEKGGYCLSPYQSMISNIGFDGSGVHCGIRQENQIMIKDKYGVSFCFPEKIEITEECEKEFQFLFGGVQGMQKMFFYQDILIRWIQMKQEGRTVQIPEEWGSNIAVWGSGIIFDKLICELQGQVSIKYIIESRPSRTEYNGIPIIPINKLSDDIKYIVVIPYFDIDIIWNKVKKINSSLNLIGIDKFF